ncbi:3138_t:CDS:1, partial [Gigaspora rosea]
SQVAVSFLPTLCNYRTVQNSDEYTYLMVNDERIPLEDVITNSGQSKEHICVGGRG